MSTAKTPLTVVFDSSNLSSRLEIERIQSKPGAATMSFVDIASGGKAEEHGCRSDAVRQAIHVRDAEGHIFVGIDAINAMHDVVGLAGYFRFCRTPGLATGPSGFFPKKKTA